jgi:phosphoglycolate phosphatase
MPYDFCLFVLDGTLTDPMIGIAKSFQYALSAFGIKREVGDMKALIGPPLRESIKRIYNFSDADTEKAVAKYREYFGETGLFENTVYPGIPELLQLLIDNGKILAVATSKATEYTVRILDRFDLHKFFKFVSGDEMDGSLTKHGKRDVINIALDALDPERKTRAVMIGDRKHDIIGARDAGIDSIGVKWGYGPPEELTAAGAALFVDSTAELGKLIIG